MGLLHDRLCMLEQKYEGQRFKRAAYICAGGQVQHVNDIGHTTITSAFINRPSDCQYCVMVGIDGIVLLVDMLDLQSAAPHTDVHHKEEVTMKFPTVEAAIMYALTIE